MKPRAPGARRVSVVPARFVLALSAAALGTTVALAADASEGDASDTPPDLTRASLVIGAERLFGVFLQRSTATLESGSQRIERSLRLGIGWIEPEAPYGVPRLGLDGFVANRWSIGGSAGFSAATGSKETRVGDDSGTVDLPSNGRLLVAPRAGYAAPIGARSWFWGRAGVTLSTELEAETSAAGQREQDFGNLWGPTAEAWFVNGLAPNVALLAGATFDLGFGNRDETELDVLSVGVASGVVAWF